MLKIGILRGMESSFPEAFIERVNDKARVKELDVSAEFVKLGATMMDQDNPYAVIVDRISQDIEYYRTYLKHAVMQGSYVINNPFWWSADDKFFSYAIANKAGITVPRTVVLPQNAHPEGTTADSMRNMIYPLNWNEILEYVGWPSFLKPHSGGGWKMVYKVHNPDEFFYYYNQTGTTCMVLQQGIEFDSYYRCYCIGREHVRIMPYEPGLPYGQQYLQGQKIDSKLEKRMQKDVLAICRMLGYDMNTVEFAVKDDVPYAIDYTNPAPDAEYRSVNPENFEWMVENMAEFALECALNKPEQRRDLHWTSFLKPQKTAPRKKSTTGKKKG